MVVVKNKYGYLTGHGVVLRPSIGVFARYSLEKKEAKVFESEEEFEEYRRTNGWMPQYQLDWTFEEV